MLARLRHGNGEIVQDCPGGAPLLVTTDYGGTPALKANPGGEWHSGEVTLKLHIWRSQGVYKWGEIVYNVGICGEEW